MAHVVVAIIDTEVYESWPPYSPASFQGMSTSGLSGRRRESGGRSPAATRSLTSAASLKLLGDSDRPVASYKSSKL